MATAPTLSKGGVIATPTASTTAAQTSAALTSGWVPVTSDSFSVRAANTATGNDISRYMSSFNDGALRAAGDAERRQIEAERAALTARRDAEVANIEKGFSDTTDATVRAQGSEYASRATNLVTSGGGFLGNTESQQGVLQNLRETQRTELSALETKKQAAVLQAKNAYDDKDFALARDLVKNAREIESQIYTRQKDYADREIQLSRYATQDKQTAFQNSLDVIDRTAASVFDQTKDLTPAAKDTYIKAIAANMGVDPALLASKVSEIVVSRQTSDRSSLSSLASKYPSAGIDPNTDDFAAAILKVRNSREYKNDQAKAEADIANVYSLIKDRNSSTATFGAITPADKAAGLNYLILKKASDQDKQRFETDRGFQAWVLNKVKLTQ